MLFAVATGLGIFPVLPQNQTEPGPTTGPSVCRSLDQFAYSCTEFDTAPEIVVLIHFRLQTEVLHLPCRYSIVLVRFRTVADISDHRNLLSPTEPGQQAPHGPVVRLIYQLSIVWILLGYCF